MSLPLVHLLVKCATAKDVEANRTLGSDFQYLNFFPQITTQDLLELEYFMLDQLGMQLSEQKKFPFKTFCGCNAGIRKSSTTSPGSASGSRTTSRG